MANHQTLRRLMSHGLWLLLCGILISPMAGCTSFQSITSDQWLDGRWLVGDSEQPVNHCLTLWDSNVRTAQDTVQGGTLHGLVGRVLLLNEETGRGVDAHGTIVVCMHDMTGASAGKAPARVAEWKFDAKSLKQLKKTDKFGDGYTLFLPWDAYHPGIKQVHLQGCYVTSKGIKHYTEPVTLTLQTEDSARGVFQEKIAAVGQQPQVAPAVRPQPQQPIVPVSGQQPQIAAPGTQIQYMPVSQREQIAPVAMQQLPTPTTQVQYLPVPRP